MFTIIELLTDIDMLLMVETGIRGRICHVIHRYAAAINRYMKKYSKDNKSSYIMYQKLPIDGFKWKKCVSIQ